MASDWEDYFEREIANSNLPKPIREYKFLKDRRFRFDFAWPFFQVAVEIQGSVWTGGRHVQGYGYTSDCEKYNLAMIDGWRVLKVTTNQVNQGKAMEWLQQYFDKLTARFMEKVDKSGDCWEWTATKHYKGYGEFQTCTCNRHGKGDKAHRVSYMLHNKELPEGLCVMHKCDNRGCVNPEHLQAGTNQDNIDDRNKKGRQATGAKGNHGTSKLTQEIVDEIRARYAAGGVTQTALATEYGLSNRHVSGIVRYEVWK